MKRLILALAALGASLVLGAQEPYPELGAKLDQYFAALAGEPASVQAEECDFLIESCRDSLVKQYTALKIYDHYLQSKIMGDDAVAVHVARKWFLSGAVQMHSHEDAFHAQLFVQFNESSLIGMQAPPVQLLTPEGTAKVVPVAGEYSVLYFYDTGCATCKLETPRLQKLASSGKYPFTVYAIYVGASSREWAAWRQEHEGFTHLWDPEMDSDWQRLYGVLQTPKMFLVNPSGEIVGRSLDTPALEILLGQAFSQEEYVYGEAAEMERLSQLFATYGDELKPDSILEVAEYLSSRTLGQGDVTSYKHCMGDLLYFLFTQRSEVFRDASIPFVQKYIQQPDIWNTEADKAQVTSLGELMLSLTGRTPAGSPVPDLKVQGTLRRKPGLFARGSRAGTFRLRNLKGNPAYLVFYSQGCQACRELLSAVDGIVKSNRKARVLLIDMDALYSDKPAMAQEMLDSFDLSVLPLVLQLDRKGTVEHRYVQLVK